MREEFMNRINARKDNDKLKKYDIASYPFGAEEMLLNDEFRNLEETENQDLQK